MRIDGAASLVLIDSDTTHCFIQYSEIPNLCAMFKGSGLKVKLATGCEFHTATKCWLPITFASSLEHIIDYYVVNKLTMSIILGI